MALNCAMATFEQLKNTIKTKWNLIETDMIHKANTQWKHRFLSRGNASFPNAYG